MPSLMDSTWAMRRMWFSSATWALPLSLHWKVCIRTSSTQQCQWLRVVILQAVYATWRYKTTVPTPWVSSTISVFSNCKYRGFQPLSHIMFFATNHLRLILLSGASLLWWSFVWCLSFWLWYTPRLGRWVGPGSRLIIGLLLRFGLLWQFWEFSLKPPQ